METETKPRGRPANGNALPAIERMKAYRARKKAQVIEECLAAGVPPPRPGRPRVRPAQPAVADAGMQARIAELEAANRKLEDEVADARRSVAYHLSEIKRLDSEKDSRGTSLLVGKEPARKHREAALAGWGASSPWHGQENLKKLQANLTRSMTTVTQLTEILSRHGTATLGYDRDVLAKSLSVLGAYKRGLDYADAHAAHAKRDAEKALKAREDAVRAKVALNIFGTETPEAAAVRAIASDLITWHRVAGDWLKSKYRGVDIAYSSINSVYELERVIDKPVALQAELLRIAVEIAGPGRRHVDSQREETVWLGGWDDFAAWRAESRISNTV